MSALGSSLHGRVPLPAVAGLVVADKVARGLARAAGPVIPFPMKSTCRPFLLLLALALVGGSSPALHAEPAEVTSLRAKAEKGNGIAQYNLGLVYSQGREDLPADLVEAFVWLSLAAENGSTGKALDLVLNKITDGQMAEGRRRLAIRRATLPSKPVAPVSVASKPAPALSNPKSPVAPTNPDDAIPVPSPVDATRSQAPATGAVRAPDGSVISVPKDNASDARQELAALRADKQRLATEFAQAWKDLKKARADAQAAAVELVSLHARVADLEAAIAATAKDHADLLAARQDAAAARAFAQQAGAEKSQVDSTLASLSADKTRAETERESARSELAAAKEQFAALSAKGSVTAQV